MKKTVFITGAAVLLLVTSVFLSPGWALEFGARGYYWFPNLYGTLRVDSNGSEGTKIDLGGDLRIGDKNFPFFEAFAGLGRHHLALMYTDVNYADSTNLSNDLIFKSRTYHAGDVVDSQVRVRMLDLEYQFDLLDLENILAGFSVGVIGKVKYIDGEAEIDDVSRGFSEKDTFGLLVPMVGAGVHVGILADILEARAKITGIGYSGNWFYEGIADISWTPFPFLDIHGGYRIMKLDVEDVSDVYANMEFSGPYVALTVGF